MLFNYGKNRMFNFIKSFGNGTILDYNNKVFIEPLSTFDSFYFCDSCYFSHEIINNKNIKYISPKVKYIFKDNILYYQSSNKLLNKKILSNLKSLNQLQYEINDNQFDNGIRRLYAENILCHFYNNFDLNICRNLFYQYYKLSDQHIVWKGIVIELIEKYPVIDEII